MFTGRYYHTIETKGRLAIPQTYREELASGGVLTWGLDGCLFLFPDLYWQKLTDKLASLSLTNPQARKLTRLFIQSSTKLQLDNQGRTLIPEFLREQAQLKKQVVVAGALTRVEIWDQEAYHKHLDLIMQEVNQADEALANLDI